MKNPKIVLNKFFPKHRIINNSRISSRKLPLAKIVQILRKRILMLKLNRIIKTKLNFNLVIKLSNKKILISINIRSKKQILLTNQKQFTQIIFPSTVIIISHNFQISPVNDRHKQILKNLNLKQTLTKVQAIKLFPNL